MTHVAASNFWLHSLTTLVPTFLCPRFAHIGSQSTFTPPPTLCNIPFTCTHRIQNPSKACAWADPKFCHKMCLITNATQASALKKNSHHYAHLQNCEKWRLASTCLSIRMKQFCSHLMDFQEILCLRIFQKIVKKIQFALKYHNNRYFTWTTTHFSDHVSHVFLRMKNISDESFKENQNTHFYFQHSPLLPKKIQLLRYGKMM